MSPAPVHRRSPASDLPAREYARAPREALSSHPSAPWQR
eukprot:CAMPEP_0183543130 /NCGR_PEP_ID=MMETSP0371-20130417/43438_1 /TAXON_ID=268820 /ORGANISM="Peridinium aciculiferum, Strain PAER-2" /LENGTH=38 /DNA_ID= /DNA_START= /DNA_END= /DNA_ORIENTATION=